MRDKKGITTVSSFQSILASSKMKANKIWVDKASELSNRPFEKRLKENYREMYSTYNGGKSAITERFMSSLKNMIYKHMAAVLQKVDVMLQMILFINIITHTIELLK